MSSVKEIVYSKQEIGIIQLEAAIDAFNNGEHIVAITLAGAAEEVFGDELTQNKQQNSLVRIAQHIVKNRPDIAKNKKEAMNFLNQVKNALKHNDRPDERTVQVSNIESYIMIIRALENARALGVKMTKKMQSFR